MGVLQGMELTTLEKMIALAVEFGPFFFALVFLFFVTRTAYQRYLAAQKEANGTDSLEIATHRKMYWATTTFCGMLVVLSMGWWFYNSTNRKLVEFAVVNLGEPEIVVSDSTYGRVRTGPKVGGRPTLQDYEFASVVDRWTGATPVVRLVYWHDKMSKGANFEVPLNFKGRPRFHIRHQGGDLFELFAQGIEPRQSGPDLRLIGTAAAADEYVIPGSPLPSQTFKVPLPQPGGWEAMPRHGRDGAQPPPSSDGPSEIELLIRKRMIGNEILKRQRKTP